MKCALVHTNVCPRASAINLNVSVLMCFRCVWDVMFSILSLSCTNKVNAAPLCSLNCRLCAVCWSLSHNSAVGQKVI